MTIEGVDYAGDRPTPAGLVAAGKKFVVRYGGPGGSWKHLTIAETQALTAAGLMLVANAEGAADGLLGGWSVGADWARDADAHFRQLGMPPSKPIYLSVDFDCDSGRWPVVAQALRGAASVIGPARVGVYGSYDVMRWARRDGVARWFWQTYAWSGGRWAGGNHLEQYRNGVTLAGGTVDLCRALYPDYGQWTTRTATAGEDDEMDFNEHQVLWAMFNMTPTVRLDTGGGVLKDFPSPFFNAYSALVAKVDAIAGRVDLDPEELALIDRAAQLDEADLAAIEAAAHAGAQAGGTGPTAEEIADEVLDETHRRSAD